jgi:5-(carboxyamino)imidazole ribonucleotide mutase
MDVLILTGSKNDLGDIDGAVQTLKKFEVSYELHISSAHRTLKRTVELVESAEKKGAKVIIAAAGMSAHLPGVVAAMTILPVIGVPLNASALNGLDSLMSIVQMPGGIPVATTAIGKSGCVNAALLAVSILALSDAVLAEKLKRYRMDMADSVIKADEEINKEI